MNSFINKSQLRARVICFILFMPFIYVYYLIILAWASTTGIFFPVKMTPARFLLFLLLVVILSPVALVTYFKELIGDIQLLWSKKKLLEEEMVQ